MKDTAFGRWCYRGTLAFVLLAVLYSCGNAQQSIHYYPQPSYQLQPVWFARPGLFGRRLILRPGYVLRPSQGQPSARRPQGSGRWVWESGRYEFVPGNYEFIPSKPSLTNEPR